VRPAAVAFLMLLAGAAGFALARITAPEAGGRDNADRSAARRAWERESDAARIGTLEEALIAVRDERDALQRRIRRYEPQGVPPEEVVPAPGTRLADGRIVGGARWNDTFVRLSTGFLDTLINGFIRDAKLTTEQERRLRETVRESAQKIMQVSADFTNGDLEGDAAYEKLQVLGEEAETRVSELLDDDQVETFRKFRSSLRGILHQQIVSNEMATLKSTLGLDADQEKRILAIVEERYRRVGEQLTTPIPNVYFKPLRRGKDAPIYEETANAIRGLLSPDQRMRFDAWEKQAPTAPYQYREQLAPK